MTTSPKAEAELDKAPSQAEWIAYNSRARFLPLHREATELERAQASAYREGAQDFWDKGFIAGYSAASSRLQSEVVAKIRKELAITEVEAVWWVGADEKYTVKLCKWLTDNLERIITTPTEQP